MRFSPGQFFEQNPHLLREWESLSLRIAHANGFEFSADLSPEELHASYRIEHALEQIEEMGRHLSSKDVTVRLKAAADILGIYSSDTNELRHDIRFHAEVLAAHREVGSEQFAFAARLIVAAATTIGLAARRANDRTTLNEIKTSLEAAASGLERAGSKDADVLAVVLRRQLSWLFT
jgi:hypothetical protein